MMVPLLVLKKARSWTISLLQRSSGHVILGMQLGFRDPSGMNSLACRLADLLVFCRSSDYVCICIIMHMHGPCFAPYSCSFFCIAWIGAAHVLYSHRVTAVASEACFILRSAN